MAAAVLFLAGVLWTRINQPFEVKVLIVFDPEHGLTVGDLPSLVAFAVALWLVWPRKAR